MANKITWGTERRKLSELIPHSTNPRVLTNKQYKDLRKSLTKFDLAEIPAINTDNTLLAGHQRIKVLAEIKGEDTEIDVRVPNRLLTKEEANEYLIRSNKNTGEWDIDSLANEFDQVDLKDWGFEDADFGIDEKTLSDDFELKDGDRPPFREIIFNLSDEQHEKVTNAIKDAKNSEGIKYVETFKNTNTNGNALYFIVSEWSLNG